MEKYMCQKAKAIVFDFDGVIAKTTLLKHQAMLSLFDDFPKQHSKISKTILSLGGVPRKKKIAHIIREYCKKKEVSETLLSDYLDRYAQTLQSINSSLDFVDGVFQFIKEQSIPLYICSSAPVEELEKKIDQLQIKHYFQGIFAGNTSKSEALQAISLEIGSSEIVFFGDAIADLNAAHEAGIAFVGVTCEIDVLPKDLKFKIDSFSNSEIVQKVMYQSIAINQLR